MLGDFIRDSVAVDVLTTSMPTNGPLPARHEASICSVLGPASPPCGLSTLASLGGASLSPRCTGSTSTRSDATASCSAPRAWRRRATPPCEPGICAPSSRCQRAAHPRTGGRRASGARTGAPHGRFVGSRRARLSGEFGQAFWESIGARWPRPEWCAHAFGAPVRITRAASVVRACEDPRYKLNQV